MIFVYFYLMFVSDKLAVTISMHPTKLYHHKEVNKASNLVRL